MRLVKKLWWTFLCGIGAHSYQYDEIANHDFCWRCGYPMGGHRS